MAVLIIAGFLAWIGNDHVQLKSEVATSAVYVKVLNENVKTIAEAMGLQPKTVPIK